MYYVVRKESEDLIVRELRTFFDDVGSYGTIFSKDYSILGNPFDEDENGQKYFLIAAGFPERFRFYPNITIKCSAPRFTKLEADNLIVQEDEINEYGRRVVKDFIEGGHVTISISFTVRTLDQTEAEEIADLISYWSLTYGRKRLKALQAFIEPATSGDVIAENMKDSTDQTKIYRINLNTTMLLSWLVRSNLDALTVSKVTVQEYDPDLI